MCMNERSLQGDFLWGQKNVMRCQIRYPQLEPGEMPGCEARLSLHYTMYARARWERLVGAYYPRACASCRRLAPYGTFAPYDIRCEYTVMYCRGGYCSVFFDTYVRQGQQELDCGRQSSTFSARDGGMIPLGRLFRRGCPYRAIILDTVRREVARQCSGDPDAYYVDWPVLVGQLDEQNYYLADDGLVVYYPRRALGPSRSGMLSFLIPYQAFGSGLIPEL